MTMMEDWMGWLALDDGICRCQNTKLSRNDNCDHAVENLIFIHVELDASYRFTHSSVRHLCKKMDVLFIRIACFKISSCLRSHPQKITQTIRCCARTQKWERKWKCLIHFEIDENDYFGTNNAAPIGYLLEWLCLWIHFHCLIRFFSSRIEELFKCPKRAAKNSGNIFIIHLLWWKTLPPSLKLFLFRSILWGILNSLRIKIAWKSNKFPSFTIPQFGFGCLMSERERSNFASINNQ